MGKRKMKFDLRKNCERKKRGCGQTVCEVSDVVNEQVPAPSLVTVSEEQLVVSLTVPIASFVSTSPAPDLHALHERLLESKCLSAAWTCSVASDCLVICKMSVVSLASADAMYTVTISSDFTWKIRIGRNEVAIEENDLLRYSSGSLCSVQSVVRVVSVLDGSKFCVGNPDDKFTNLVQRRKGKFMDKSGNCTVL
ncbi:hypothetical protein SPONN_2650 [uncultured Candidatus Thioglobus sp.]|nr:hypothetical protein SPONN_2650 [uncultured Candidatus Thioglobus sp.]